MAIKLFHYTPVVQRVSVITLKTVRLKGSSFEIVYVLFTF